MIGKILICNICQHRPTILRHRRPGRPATRLQIPRPAAHGQPPAAQCRHVAAACLTGFIAKLLMMARYKPALCKGQPCGQDYLLLATLTDE
ncbi:hypothetical protein [Pseudoduganella buxea]|uniref:Uncharacterized protein n=1 Tax=Pseudoduganella buxea TaxID=1949069 RepID=A0A6I3SZU8_9BURK|nr:hypothetical protein [Pseudoduganella buxea]MTV54861.1 hypothetical protein [Pseudoduganella buxea]GGC21011.1 hypothetical protein GCM10011572_48090 [Pseudoduganella buxea]